MVCSELLTLYVFPSCDGVKNFILIRRLFVTLCVYGKAPTSSIAGCALRCAPFNRRKTAFACPSPVQAVQAVYVAVPIAIAGASLLATWCDTPPPPPITRAVRVLMDAKRNSTEFHHCILLSNKS